MIMPDAVERPRRIPKPGRLVRLWPRVRPYRGMLAAATVALILSGLASLAFPMVVRYLLDAAFVNRNRELLDRIALGLVALFCVQAVLNYLQAYLLSATGEQAGAGLPRELVRRPPINPPGFLSPRRDGAPATPPPSVYGPRHVQVTPHIFGL